jgi:hypothetical protein
MAEEQPKKLTLKEQNARHQMEYRQRLKNSDIDKYREMKKKEMKAYRDKRKNIEEKTAPPKAPKEQKIKEPKIKEQKIEKAKIEEPKKIIELSELPKIKGKPKANKDDIIPLYKLIDKKLEQVTIDGYITRINIINEMMLNRPLTDPIKEQIIKALKGEQFYTSVLAISLKYLKDINDVVKKIRNKYQNDNTFRSYINALTVILSRLPLYKQQYQHIAKLNIKLLQDYTAERNKNILKKEDEPKMISFTSEEINSNILKLKNIDDKIIYVLSVYFLRRLEIRNLILSLKEEDDNKNYMIVDENNNPIELIFNQYKTSRVFKKDKKDIPDEIKGILKEYLDKNKIQAGEYVLGQYKDKKKPIGQGNFSNKIKNVFNKLYNADITNRWIRQAYTSERTDKEFLDKLEEYKTDASKLSHSLKSHKEYIRHKK